MSGLYSYTVAEADDPNAFERVSFIPMNVVIKRFPWVEPLIIGCHFGFHLTLQVELTYITIEQL